MKTTRKYNVELSMSDVTVVTPGKTRVHHNECTWCRSRRITLGTKSKEIERCALTGKAIPLPFTGDRYCESYQQIECDCEKCKSKPPNV